MATQFRVLALACAFVAAAPEIDAADKSGVTPNTISLPKGPGSIEGLGESFQPTLNTGTSKYGLALKLPPGTAGHAPALRLEYDGGGANGILGFGWQLSLPCIQRRCDKGIPRYVDDPSQNTDPDWAGRLDVFINEAREELVPQTNGAFFCKNEGVFIRYRRIADHWEGALPNGTVLQFGLTPNGRIQDDSNPNRVFSWLLERSTDTHGNVINYAYVPSAGSSNLNQKFLSTIAYGPGALPWNNYHFVAFAYEDRTDWFEDCRPGFQLRTGKRLKSIFIGTQGTYLPGHLAGDFDNDGTSDFLDRRYDLNYLNYAGTNSHWSLLASVQQVGADGVSALPPATFGYTVCNPPDTLSAAGLIIGGLNEPSFVMSNPTTDFLDLNGDGLPDVLMTFPDGSPHRACINQGQILTNGIREIRWSAPVEIGGDPLAANFNLASGTQIAHLADMDGDGIADFVYTSAVGDVYFFKNQATASWGSRQLMSVQNYPPPSPFGSADVKTADLDFDKRIDIVQSVSTGNGADYRIWFNLGNQHYSSSKTVPQNNGFMFSWPGVQIADFNGDRVPDIMQLRPTGLTVTAGLGYGNFVDPIFVSIPDYNLTDDQIARAKLIDITGDGLADLVIERAISGQLWYWVNLGNYSFSTRKVITDMPTGIGINRAIRWADLNGNGTTDYIYADQSNVPRLQAVDIGELFGCVPSPNTLVAISNGIGRVTTINYQPSTIYSLQDAAAGAPWPDPMPFPVSVVAGVTNLDSLGHQYVSQFRYHNGYYDSAEKQFRGFARVEQIDLGDPTAPTLVTRSSFDTGRTYESMKGKLLALSTEQEDGSIFEAETNLWTTPPVTLYTGTNGTNVVYAHPTGTVRIISEAGQGTRRRLESEFAYDIYGNETTNADYGIVENGDRSAFSDERITITEYAINTNAWILRLPARQEVRDELGAAISRTEHFYDDETFSGNNWGIVTIGNLTLKRDWIFPSNYSATISSARTKFDGYGNPVTILDPLAIAPGGSVDIAKGHAREIAYDARFHTFPVTETIYLGDGKTPLLFEAAYDQGFGTVSSSTDFNTNTTTYGYDTFARLTSIVKPGDTPAYPTVECDYALAVPFSTTGLVNFIETRQLDKTPAAAGAKRDHYLLSRQFVDGLGRKLLTKQEAEPGPGSSAPRVVVTEAVQFNARENAARVLNPFFSLLVGSLDDQLAFENIEAPGWTGSFALSNSLVTLDLASAHATRTDYDATLRPIRVSNPDGTQRRTFYEPLLTRSFDENQTDPVSQFFGASMVHSNDGLGRLIQVDETSRLNDDGTSAGALRAWTTRYEYDLNDQLTRITDSQNNVKTFAYDGLKRKTDMNDPDRGVMHFVYDDASNLTETTDAKAQRITYTYDGGNRIRSEKFHDAQPAPPWRSAGEGATNSVVYHYDTPFPNLPQGDNTVTTAQNVKGALAWVEDLSGEEHTSYDSRGRVESVVKRISDPLTLSSVTNYASLVSYATRFAYDSLDRLTNLTYPDADKLRYEYNDRNLLQRIPGGFTGGQAQPGNILANLLYLPSGQMAQIDYGNGVRTTYAYDSRLRLKNLLTVSQPSTLNQQLINFAYDFDGVSNIKSIADLRPGSAVPEGDPRRNTQLFQYDDLYRLTRVQYFFALPGAASRNDGEINYRYDRIGNMLAQTSTLNHQEHGLPVANLGQMDSGGSAGRWNRTGRAPSDPAGPHALTSITPTSTNSHRVYPYDSNGNMTNIDGLVCTWDFKDRLVAVENAEMRAAYTYDYTDRRITKRVVWKPGYPLPSDGRGAGVEGTTTVSYINKYFEVREHDAPTKYVWNGNTRVARVTGSLNTGVRVQRLRVHPGWNLCSLAVNGPLSASGAEGQGDVVSSAFKWNPASQDWQPVTLGASLPSGTILWLQATTNATLTVTGDYADPTNRTVTASGDFLPSAGLEAWNILSTLSNQPSTTLWTYDAPFTRWLSWLPPPLELQSDLPAFLAPGQAVFARADALAQLEVPESALRIRYYHQDHIGSSSCLSDSMGDFAEESEFYPFGHPRMELRPRGLNENYTFAQKEQDLETALHYFEARFVDSRFSRFLRTDPLSLNGPRKYLLNPQLGHPYSYAANNPLVFSDPTGTEVKPNLEYEFGFKADPGGAGTDVSLKFGVEPEGQSAKRFGQLKIKPEGVGALFEVGKTGNDWYYAAGLIIGPQTYRAALNLSRLTGEYSADVDIKELARPAEIRFGRNKLSLTVLNVSGKLSVSNDKPLSMEVGGSFLGMGGTYSKPVFEAVQSLANVMDKYLTLPPEGPKRLQEGPYGVNISNGTTSGFDPVDPAWKNTSLQFRLK